MGLEIRYFKTAAERSQPADFLAMINPADRALIVGDIGALSEYGPRAPISTKAIKGHHGLYEIRTGGFRTFYCVNAGRVWILHICRKQDQRAGIAAAAQRMKRI